MEEQNVPDNKNVDGNGSTPAPQGVPAGKVPETATSREPDDSKSTAGKKKIIICISGIAVLIIVLLIVGYLLIGRLSKIQWLSNQMIAIYIAIGVIATVVGVWVFLRKTFRTRLKMQKEMKEDPDVTDWLIIFNWTPKILYTPTIIASLIASLIMYLKEADLWFFSSTPAVVIGGIWLAIFFLNFLIEEYSMSIKILIIALVSLGCFLLWLNLLGWVMGFLRLFKHLALSVNATGYLLVGIIGLFTIFVSWIKGLFYYLAITPNDMNIQEGPTESGEQIGREDYNSRIDTSDFLERLMGFGKIIITFKDKKREPISVLTWRIQKKSQMLERVRGKFAIDYPQQTQPKI
jgi:hypothetical protein